MAEAPDFQFLRLEKPDVMRYLPKFLAEDERFKNVQKALSGEHEIQRQELIDLGKQLFVDTATWGLIAWEKVYQTNPPVGASIDLRRALLRAKMLGNRTMTKANLEMLINQFVRNHDAYIIEETAPGEFKIIVPSLIAYWQDMVNMLMEMVPAHLVINVEYQKDKTTGTIYNGVLPYLHKTYTIKPAEIQDAETSASAIFGGLPSTHNRYEVFPREIRNSSTAINQYIGVVNTLYKHFSVEEES